MSELEATAPSWPFGGTLIVPPYQPATSPQVKALIHYLMSLGAPSPIVRDFTVSNPGATYNLDELVFQDNDGHSAIIDASVGALFPNLAANDLFRNKIITLPAELPNVPVPSVNGSAYPSHKPTPAPLKYTTPIGPLDPVEGHETDGVGSFYQNNPGYVFPFGTVYTDLPSPHQYRMTGADNPFGRSVWWVRLK